MNVLIIGSGMMGSAMAYDFAHSPGVEKIYLSDIDADRAKNSAAAIGKKVEARELDVQDYPAVVALMKEVDVTCGATSYTHNARLTKAAIEAGSHFCDLGGNMDV